MREERALAADLRGQPTDTASPTLRWSEDAPSWQAVILARVDHWGDAEPWESRFIALMIMEVCNWLEALAAQELLDTSRPFHEILLQAFSVDQEPGRVEAMREKVLKLDSELERFKASAGIGKQLPGEPRVIEAGRPSPDHDPVSVVARKLRKELEEIER